MVALADSSLFSRHQRTCCYEQVPETPLFLGNCAAPSAYSNLPSSTSHSTQLRPAIIFDIALPIAKRTIDAEHHVSCSFCPQLPRVEYGVMFLFANAARSCILPQNSNRFQSPALGLLTQGVAVCDLAIDNWPSTDRRGHTANLSWTRPAKSLKARSLQEWH